MKKSKDYEAMLEKLKTELEDMHLYYMKKAREIIDDRGDDELFREYSEEEKMAYQSGKIDGSIDMIQTVNLMMFGGKSCWDTWIGALAEMKEDIGEDASDLLDMMTGGKNAPRFTGDEEDDDEKD